jgi:hypothetical protein
MLREGATCEVLRDILGRVNIDATQNFFARADGTNEWIEIWLVVGRDIAISLSDHGPVVRQ